MALAFTDLLDPMTRSPTVSPRRFRGDRRARFAVAGLVVVTVMALAGPWIWRISPTSLDLANAGAGFSPRHPLGTDESGRDVLSRLLHGGRVSLAVGFGAMALSLVVGTVVGAVAGYRRGRLDTVLMRLTDAILSLPVIFIVITIVTFVGSATATLVVAIGVTSWMGLARLVRGELLALREQPFVEAARAIGQRPWRILLHHLLPHLWPSMLVNATLGVGTAVLTESALSFIGLGVQPPTASWGNMLSGAQTYLFSYPWLAAWPGLMILVTVLAINLLGEALRDALDEGLPR